MSYTVEQAAGARTAQAILTLGVPYCANWYSIQADQVVESTDDFSSADWTKTGVTVTDNDIAAPDGTPAGAVGAADKLVFAAVGDNIRPFTSGGTAASNAYTGTVFVLASSAGTITLRIRDGGSTELNDTQVAVTTGWNRLQAFALFTAGASGVALMEIRRAAGDLATIWAWGYNLTKNPGAANRAIVWPYRRRGHGEAIAASNKGSRCTVADAGDGSRCFYTMPTCQDPANYNAGNDYEATPALRGIREYKFCKKDAPLPFAASGDIAPLIESYDQAAQEIPVRAGTTRDERTTYHLYDDARPGVWDLMKQGEGGLVNTARGLGTLFRRFLPIHKNYSNPLGYAKLAVGYIFYGNPGTPHTEADFRQRLKGPILNVKLDARGRVVLEAGDTLQNLKKKIPTKISSTNLLVGALSSGAASLVVDDASEFEEPPIDGSYKATILIDSEKINYATRNLTTNTLGGLERGRWGTNAAAHADNAVVTAVVEFGTERTTPSNPVLGINPINALVQLLRRAGIPAADINSTALNAERDTWLITTIDPGPFGVQAGVLFRRTITEPIEIDKLIYGEGEWRDSISTDVFVDEDQRVTGKVYAPPTADNALYELTDVSHFIAESIEIEDDNEARISRIVYAWDLIPGEKGEAVQDFAQVRARILTDEEARGYFGTHLDKIILSKWLSGFDLGTAQAVGGHLANRFRRGARFLSASLEAKDDDNVKLGSYVYVSTAWLQTTAGATDSKKIMQVVKKVQLDQETGRMQIRCLDAALSGRFWFWQDAAGAPASYDVATPEQQRFAFWAGSNGRVGAGAADPYLWW